MSLFSYDIKWGSPVFFFYSGLSEFLIALLLHSFLGDIHFKQVSI
jgi:hypothetical protein